MNEDKKDFFIREYGVIKPAKESNPEQKSIEEIIISKQAWEKLKPYADDHTKGFIIYKNSTTFQVRNYVGVISTNDGTQIEILPKINNKINDEKDLEKTRKILLRMLGVVTGIKSLEATEADLKTFKQPLHEVLITIFLNKITAIVKRGIRFDYNRIAAHEKFLKGSLRLTQQIHEPPYNQHLFHIEYDEYSANRVENQLIKSALLQITKWTKSINLKRARKLLNAFYQVDESHNYSRDLQLWQNHAQDKNIDYYQSSFPLIRLILNQQNPFTQKAHDKGVSFLFPMEKLFEKYVAEKLKIKANANYQIKTQERKKSLAQFQDKPVYRLQPDIVIYDKNNTPLWVLDTKWKRIDGNDPIPQKNKNNNYSIKQSDMYQLYAYAKKYKIKQLMLIYPQWENFDKRFHFTFDDHNDEKILWVMPFDLSCENEQLIKLINFS